MRIFRGLLLLTALLVAFPTMGTVISFANSGDISKLDGSMTNLTFGYTIPTSGYSTPQNSTGAYCTTGYSRYVQVKSSEGVMTLTSATDSDTAMVSVVFANTTNTCVTTGMGTSVGIATSSSTVYSTDSLKVGFVNSGTTARYGRLMYSTTNTSSYSDFAGRDSASDITLESGKWYQLVGYFRKTSTANIWTVTVRLLNLTDNVIVDQITQEGISQSSVYNATSLSAGLSWNRSSAAFSENLAWSIEKCAYTSGTVSFANSGDTSKLSGNLTNLTCGYTIPTSGYSIPPNSTGAYCTTGYSRYARVKSSEGTMTLTPATASDTAMVSVVFANTTSTCVTTGMGTSVGIVNAAGSSTVYSTDSLKVGFVNSGTTARHGRLMYSTTNTSSYSDFAGRDSASDITLESGKWYQLVGYFRKTSTANIWTVTVRLLNLTDNVIMDQIAQEGISQSSVYNATSLSAGLSWNRSSATFSENLAWSIEQPAYFSNYSEIVIDTDFSDWNVVPGIFDRPSDGFNQDLAEVKIANDNDSLYFYIRTKDEFGGAICSLACIYIDIDNNPATGYLVGPSGQQIGADYSLKSNRRTGASSANGALLASAALFDPAASPIGSFACNAGLAPWDISSGVNEMEMRAFLSDLGIGAGDAITYVVGVTKQADGSQMDWLNVKQTYTVAHDRFASKPAPANGGRCGGGNTLLGWREPADTTTPSYDVYLGTNYNSVSNADTGSAEYMTSTNDPEYNTSILTANTTYYWRIDVHAGESVYKGKVWTFTTAIPAFPGAEGAGMWSLGGRGGDVYHVTNLNDSGAGSLRYGIENATGARTIVFDVSGTIQMNADLVVNTPNMTIAGQTALGEGITLTKRTLQISKGDVILRHLRGRPGDLIGPCDDAEWVNCLTIDGQYGGTIRNIIVDHFSGSWSIGKILAIIGTTSDVTFQWSTLFEGLHDSINPKGPHSMAALVRPNIDGRFSLHHNVFAHNNARNPRPGVYDGNACLFDFRNNVVYNYGNEQAGYSGAGEITNINYIGNYIIRGSNGANGFAFRGFDATNTVIYQAGNYFDNNRNGVFDGANTGWSMFQGTSYTAIGTEFTFPNCTITTETADEALAKVLASSGCLLPSRDSEDNRVVGTINNGNGIIINSQNDVGGWPILYSLTAPADTDQDGIPDYWETQYSLDANNADDRNGDNDSDGYTNLEEYLNNTDPVENGSPIVYITVVDSRAEEGDSSNTGVFVVNRTGNTSSALTVYITITGNATDGADYATISPTVTIPSGSSSAIITVIPLDDISSEGDEQVIISIAVDANYKIGLPCKALVAITDND